MKKIYQIKIGDRAYEVEVVAVKEEEGSLEIKAPEAKPSGEGTRVTAPLQGGIFSLAVAEGEQVTKGQVLLVIEAMKLENEIVAPVDGTVRGIAVAKGDTVDAGSHLLSIV